MEEANVITTSVMGDDDPGATTPPAEGGEQERLYAGKFKSVEELEKGYTNLQTKIGSPQKAETDPQDSGEPATPATSTNEILQRAGVDQSEIADQFAKEGRLSDDNYAKLAEQGYPKEVVDAFLQGQVAQVRVQEYARQDLRNEAFEIAGGEQKMTEAMEWAKGALNDTEKAHFDQMMDSDTSTSETVRMATEWLMARHKAAVGDGMVNTAGQPSRPTPGVQPLTDDEFAKLSRADRPLTDHEKHRLMATNIALF